MRRQHAVAVAAVRFDGADVGPPRARRARRDRRRRRRRDRPVEPDRLDRPGAGRARRPRRPSTRAATDGGRRLARSSPAPRSRARPTACSRELGHESSVGRRRPPLRRARRARWSSTRPTPTCADAVEAEGVRCVVAPTIMSTPERAAALGRAVARRRRSPPHEPARGLRHRRASARSIPATTWPAIIADRRRRRTTPRWPTATSWS